MSDIERIKEATQIDAIINEDEPLEPVRGRYRRGKNHDSLVVDLGKQQWWWNQQGQHGDVIDWLVQRRGMTVKEAVVELARRAGLEPPAWGEREAKAASLRREREAVFDAAMAFFREQLKLSPAAMQYCRERGWEEETTESGCLGYYPGPDGPLRDALTAAEIDPAAPTAQALLKLPKGMLIYGHEYLGRVKYLSGRSIQGKRHYNPEVELVGDRQPFFNQAYRLDADRVVVVEGQADAISLGQWEIAAVGVCGVGVAAPNPHGPLPPTPSPKGLGEGEKGRAGNALLSALARHGVVVLGLDDDKAGTKGTEGLARGLMGAGVSATRIRTVKWPTKDANDWLKEGADAAEAQRLVAQGQTWLDVLAERAQGATDQDKLEPAVRAVFDALTTVAPFEVSRMRGDLAERLAIGKKEFDELLKTARREAGLAEDGKPKYMIEGGRICRRYFSNGGEEVVSPLCNFNASIVEDLLRDDGLDQEREFRLRGQVGKVRLADTTVTADDFFKMGWVLRAWGSRAIVEAGRTSQDHLRTAIQYLSRDIKRRSIYTHTGWREINGRWAYLSAAGAVGDDDVDVELDTDLELYSVPTVAEDPAEAMRASMEFLTVAPNHVTVPLWAAMWLAPLREIVNVAFALWVYGATGTMKSTLVALALNHFGEKFDDKHLPAGFTDTANRLEHKAFVCKDMPLVVDDFAPQKDAQSYREYTKTAQRLIRAVGNLTGRGRLTADAQARRTYIPRALVIVTGEDLPSSESIQARLFTVEISRGDVGVEALSALQSKRERLCHAMSGYLAWLSAHRAEVEQRVPERWRQYRQDAFAEALHLRLPEAVAGLFVGAEMGLVYAKSLGVINEEEYTTWREIVWTELMRGAQEQAMRVKDEKPELLFVHAVKDLLTQDKIHFKPLQDGPETEVLGGTGPGSELLGWHDENYLYLMGDASYNRVVRHFRDVGQMFPVRQVTLRKMMSETGMIVRDPKTGRFTQQIWVESRTHRVIVMLREAVEQGE